MTGATLTEVFRRVWWHMGKKQSHGAMLQAEHKRHVKEKFGELKKVVPRQDQFASHYKYQSTYTREEGDAICAIVASGQTVASAARILGIKPATVYYWGEKNYDDFQERLIQAKLIGVDCMADEAIEIADDSSKDMKIDKNGNEVVNHEVVQRSKLKIETRKWYAGIINPRKYGEKLQLNQTITKTVSEDPETINLLKDEWTAEHSE